jgi:uncharacterized protein (DUF1697 family)
LLAQVVLLRGVNVGGHRRFRPSQLAEQLRHLDAVNIGATGILVIRGRISQSQLRAEIARRLPFQTEIMICPGRAILTLVARDYFSGQPQRSGIIRFVSMLGQAPRSLPTLPLQLPQRGPWMVKVIAIDGRFAIGLYRRQIKAIGYLGKLDQLLGMPVTTRNWNSMQAIATVLTAQAPGRPR